MDVGRDLIDHRITDAHGEDAGMVDDLWMTWDPGTATVGNLVSGTAALIGQLGPAARPLTRAAQWFGCRHALQWREIPWDRVDRVERPQVVLALARGELPTLPGRSQPSDRSTARLYTELIKLPVRTNDGSQLGILDVRTASYTSGAPTIIGLLLTPHPHGYTLGMKRYDTTSTRLGGIAGAFFLPCRDIATITDAITTRLDHDELSPLADAPQPHPPPMPAGAQKP
jgi:sporulation protein YlmC with PRC-barrel domain